MAFFGTISYSWNKKGKQIVTTLPLTKTNRNVNKKIKTLEKPDHDICLERG